MFACWGVQYSADGAPKPQCPSGSQMVTGQWNQTENEPKTGRPYQTENEPKTYQNGQGRRKAARAIV